MSSQFDPEDEFADSSDGDVTEFDTEPTIIIDEDGMDDVVSEEAYTVRRKSSAEEVEPEVEEVLVVLPDADMPYEPEASKARLESPMQAVLDSAKAEDVGLLSAHPDEPAAEPGYAEEAAAPAMYDGSVESADFGEESLPDLEDVEDITAMIEDEEVELEAPSEPFFVTTSAEPQRSYGKWLSVAALIAIMVVGGIYGPQFYQSYTGQDAEANSLAKNATPQKSSGAAVEPAGPAVANPSEATEPEVVPTEPGVAIEPDAQVEFQQWLDSAIGSNLTPQSNSAER